MAENRVPRVITDDMVSRAFYGLDINPTYNPDGTQYLGPYCAAMATMSHEKPVPARLPDLEDDDGAASPRRVVDDDDNSVSNSVPGNYKESEIPLSQNCAFYLSNLPPTLTVGRMLDHVRNCGRVYYASVDPPIMVNNQHYRNGKVVFFEAEAGRKFIQQSRRFGLDVLGRTARVFSHDRRVGEIQTDKYVSRVLVIHGKTDIVRPINMIGYLETFMTVDVDRSIIHGTSKVKAGYSVIEMQFPTFGMASRAAEVMKMNLPDQLEVQFGEDPCAIPEGETHNEKILWELVW